MLRNVQEIGGKKEKMLRIVQEIGRKKGGNAEKYWGNREKGGYMLKDV